jgi:arginyl-tRNA synthetase
MTDEQPPQPTSEPASRPATEAWRDVGKQFEALGHSLAAALRAAWHDENTQRGLREMQTGLETMVNQVSQAVKEAAESPDGQKVRTEAERAAQSLRSASEKTWQETKPQVVSALRQLNAELQKAISQLDESKPDAPPEPPKPQS